MYPFFGKDFNELALSLLLAAFLGGLIGIERERTKVPAGFRTHVLVTLGSALVMTIPSYMGYMGEPGSYDPLRLGAQVISGIGFLGAGTIIRYKASVRGLTTAAGLWASACVGLACGAGFYSGAVITTAIILLTLITLKKVEKRFLQKGSTFIVNITGENTQLSLPEVYSICARFGFSVSHVDIEDTAMRCTITSKSGADKEAFLDALKNALPDTDIFQR